MLPSDVMEESGSRALILRMIQEQGDLIGVQDLCAASGLHPNTVRTHLDALLAAGEIEREQAPVTGRGRPLWLYRRAAKKLSPYEMLTEALTHQLDQVADPALLTSAAKRWADAATDGDEILPTNTDEAVDQVAKSLENVGFSVSLSRIGDEITISECPYAAIVETQPRVCNIHAALVVELLSRSAQPVTLDRLDVWVKPGICVAHLNRADLNPTRSITPLEIQEFVKERNHDGN